MSDVIGDAAEVLVPLLSVGAGVAARDIAERGGDHMADAVMGVLAKLRARLKRQSPTKDNIEAALRSEMSEGRLAEEHLKAVIALGASSGSTHIEGVHVEGNAVVGGTVKVNGNFILGDSNS